MKIWTALIRLLSQLQYLQVELIQARPEAGNFMVLHGAIAPMTANGEKQPLVFVYQKHLPEIPDICKWNSINLMVRV